MKRLISFALLIPIPLILMGAPPAVVHAQNPVPDATLDLIIQTSGSAQVLASQVGALGGDVHFVYRNTPAIAASIPFDKQDAVSHLAGVTSVQKDLPVRLPEDRPASVVGGQMAKPWSFPVETSAVVRPLPINKSNSKPNIEPKGYANFMYTGANQIWEETGYGAGSVVAVVDTGVYPNTCLQHAVIGAPGYPQGYNATDDGIPATDIQNHPHGTWVSGVVAGDCYLDFSDYPDDPLYQAIAAYLPWVQGYVVPLFGQAPLATIYPVKVLTYDGYSSFSIVLQGLDHVLSLKRDGLLDIDVVNMSLGWPSLYEEGDIFENMVSLLNEAGILVVSAAGNEGAIPNSILTPASTSASLAVGGLDYAPSTRVFFEWIGLVFGPDWEELSGDEGPGMGMVMRPSDETKQNEFASRGPLSNGQMAPDLTAQSGANLIIDQFDAGEFGFGTSFGTPSVAGVAALLNAYLETMQGQEDAVLSLRNALLKGASLEALGELWRGVNDTGFGALDAVGALELIKSGDLNLHYPVEVGKLRANILGAPLRGHTETYQSGEITLQPLESFDRVFAISPFTSKVTIEVYDMDIPDNSDRAAWSNTLQLNIQSAKRGMGHPVLWWLNYQNEIARVEITDGPWLFNGDEGMYWPMEPGLMKVTMLGDVQNEVPVSFKLRIVRENYRPMLHGKLAEGEINSNQWIDIPVTMPEGISQATFDLVFNRDWSKFPTSDIDMYIVDPEGNIIWDGASYNAPERALAYDPMPGEWWASLYGYELYKPDHYTLYLNTESYGGE